MTTTQQVTEFNAAHWQTELRGALRSFLLRAAYGGVDFTEDCAKFKALFDSVPPAARVQPGMPELMNRLASLAQASPNLFDPRRTPQALKMQDVAINRCSAIMQIMYNGEKK